MSQYDLKITGGRIIDGSGEPAFRGDLGIKHGSILAIGTVDGDADETIDAEGMVVCPGFVDIHTHYDAQILWDRMLSISPWHGVTSVVMGSCGFGIAPTRAEHRRLIMRTLQKVEGMSLEALEEGLGTQWPFNSFPEYLDTIEQNGVAINVAAFVGHTPIRLFVMGEDAVRRAATDDEIARMCAIVKEAIGAGAIGFGTSRADTHNGYDGLPVPSRLASDAEFQALARSLGEAGEGTLQMSIGKGDYLGFMEELARLSGAAITWTALLGGYGGPGSHRPILKRTAEMQAAGLRIVPQVSCKPIVFEYDLEEPFPLEVVECMVKLGAGTREARLAAYGDPEFRRTLTAALARRRPTLWQNTQFTHAPGETGLFGRPVSELAEERRTTPEDLVLDVALRTDLGVRIASGLQNVDENEVAELLRDPNVVLCLSDAGAHASQICDSTYPTHLLGHWVREKGVLSLEEAVRLLTSRPARVMGIKDRGLLARGRPADVVIFDPARVGPRPTRREYDFPARAPRLVAEAEGIGAVIVNGIPIRRDGRDVIDTKAQLPGRLLRHGMAQLRSDSHHRAVGSIS